MSKSNRITKKPDRKIFAAERHVGSYIEDLYKPPSQLKIKDILAMKQEPTIKIGIWFYNTIIQSGLADYIHPDEEIQTFVRENMNRIKLNAKLPKLLSYHWVGASVSEMVWDYLDGKWQYTDLVYLRPESWFPKGLPVKETDPIIQVLSGLIENPIPRDKCLILTDSDDSDEPSVLDGAAYKFWVEKNKTYQNWCTVLDQFAKPKTEITYQQSSGLYGPDGQPIDEAKEAQHYADKAEAYRKSSSFAHDEGIQVETTSPPANMGNNYETKLHYDDTMMLRGMLLLPLLIQGNDGGSGSRALGEVHYDFFWKFERSSFDRFSKIELKRFEANTSSSSLRFTS